MNTRPTPNDQEKAMAGGAEDALTKPHPLQPALEPHAHAPGPVVEFGRAYWAVRSRSAMAGVRWLHRARELPRPLDGEPHHVAGAGVRALAPEPYRCADCGERLVLINRAAYEAVLCGRTSHCRACTPGFENKVDEVLATAPGPDRHERQQPEDRRRALLRQWFPVRFTPSVPIPAAGVRHELLVLGMLRHSSPSPAPLLPAARWPMPIAPRDLAPLWLSFARLNGLVRIHPDSPPEAFISTVPGGPQVTDSMLVTHYTPYGTDAVHAADNVEHHLTARLRLAAGTSSSPDRDPDTRDSDTRDSGTRDAGGRNEEWRSTVRELLAHECLDYARSLHTIPLPAHLGQRLLDAVAPVLEHSTLGHACAVVWRTYAGVNNYLDRGNRVINGLLPDPYDESRMWESGMRLMEHAADAATRPDDSVRPFTDLRAHRLSAATHALADLLDTAPLQLGTGR